MSLWLPEVASNLSQGDILSPFPIGCSHSPAIFLRQQRDRSKTGEEKFTSSPEWKGDHNGVGNYVAKGSQAHLIVLSHHCEVDKAVIGEARVPILVAPLRTFAGISQEQKTAYCNYLRIAFFPVVELEGVEDSYADLRYISSIPAKIALGLTRQASMTDDGVYLLRAHVSNFFTRTDLSPDAR